MSLFFRDPFTSDPFFRDVFFRDPFTPLLTGSNDQQQNLLQNGTENNQDSRAVTNSTKAAWDAFRRGPKLDVVEKDKHYVVHADLPGLKKEDIDIRVEDNDVLVISGERKSETRDENDQVHRHERVWGKFSRAVRLPDAQMDKSQANLENGVLTITLPKVEKKDHVKKITIG